MLSYITVFVCFAGAVLGQSQKPCCWYNQLQAVTSQRLGLYDKINNYASLLDTDLTTYIDYSVGKIYTTGQFKNGSKTMYLETLDDFDSGKAYTVYNGYCIKTNLTTPIPSNCVPEKSTFLGSHVFGGMEADTWVLSPPSDINNLNMTRITVSKKNCVPLHQVNINFGDKSRMTLTTFQNVTKGISDPNVFNIPSACTKGMAEVPHMYVVGQEHLGLRKGIF